MEVKIMLNTNGLTESLEQSIELAVCEITQHMAGHRVSKPELRIELFLKYADRHYFSESYLSYLFNFCSYTYGDLYNFILRYRQNVTAALYAAKG